MEREKQYNEYTDDELIELVHNGDSSASEFIITKYKDLVRVKARAYFIVGADKEDIIQEGMIGLFKAIRDYNSNKNVSFFSFAELCITRQIFTAIKSATRQKHIPLNSYISLNKQAYDSDVESLYIDFFAGTKATNPEEVIIDQEEKNFIEEYINEYLSDLECKVLAMYLKGKSYLEMSKILNKDEKSIDNAIQRVRKKIEKAVSNKNVNN